jgi:hypothetical protein
VTRLKWKLDSVCLQIVLILTQDRCTVCDECTIGSKIILELLVDVGHVESCFSLFGDSVSAGAREVHDLRQTNHKVGKPFWTHLIELLCDVGHVESHFDPFGGSVNIGVR